MSQKIWTKTQINNDNQPIRAGCRLTILTPLWNGSRLSGGDDERCYL